VQIPVNYDNAWEISHDLAWSIGFARGLRIGAKEKGDNNLEVALTMLHDRMLAAHTKLAKELMPE